MLTYTIPAMSTETAANWAEALNAGALREIADWCETAAEGMRAPISWAPPSERGALIADCARFEATAAHLRGLIMTIENTEA